MIVKLVFIFCSLILTFYGSRTNYISNYSHINLKNLLYQALVGIKIILKKLVKKSVVERPIWELKENTAEELEKSAKKLKKRSEKRLTERPKGETTAKSEKKLFKKPKKKIAREPAEDNIKAWACAAKADRVYIILIKKKKKLKKIFFATMLKENKYFR